MSSIYSHLKKMSPQLLVANLEQSLNFYTGKLGFNLAFRYQDFYAVLGKDPFSIHLKLGKPLQKERIQKRNNQDIDITFSVDNIEDLYLKVLAESIEIVQPLRSMPYAKEFYIADPDGYILAFIEETKN
ncbi:VOC family protein [Pedobacter montanisoli]|uniref:VOC family protein n=1 Tax=Pedobacter montanisoli TaxID=2923277 RepID=A0ABS9ZXD5_9SPHI|nr:VOC family protein [Pedobacter montanisoli]MCJ0742991.1 VOC family protein [Pedobacter montanisoli]